MREIVQILRVIHSAGGCVCVNMETIFEDIDDFDLIDVLDALERDPLVDRVCADTERRRMLVAMQDVENTDILDDLDFGDMENTDMDAMEVMRKWTGETTVVGVLRVMKTRRKVWSFKKLYFIVNNLDMDDESLQKRHSDAGNKMLREIYERYPDEFEEAGYKISPRWTITNTKRRRLV